MPTHKHNQTDMNARLIQEFSKVTTVIIRSVGERTTDECEEALRRSGFSNIMRIVDAIPFTECLHKTFQRGIDAGRPWTLCIDADVIVKLDGVVGLIKLASEADKSIFEIQVNILDKFQGKTRHAGNHLYRTKYLKQALEFIPQEFEAIRPESYMIKCMKKAGYLTVTNNEVLLGIHDFDQFYHDIFRKCFIYAHKFLHESVMILPYWRKRAKHDNFFKVALLGFSKGLQYLEKASINKNQYHKLKEESLRKLGISEKDRDLKQVDVREVISQFEYNRTNEAEWLLTVPFKNLIRHLFDRIIRRLSCLE